MTHYRRMMLGLALMLLMLSLTACASSHVARNPTPDSTLLIDCPVPALTLDTQGQLTNAALSQYALSATDSLIACNEDKAALRKFYEVMNTP